MDMELWTWSSGENRVLLLNTQGKPPTTQERGLFLCRSLTLPADRLLMGPTVWGPCPAFVRLDWEGVRIPADKEDAAAFLHFYLSQATERIPRQPMAFGFCLPTSRKLPAGREQKCRRRNAKSV